jgi:hypothetical protein
VSFLLYATGYVVLVTGLAWLATVAGLSQTYVLIGAAVLLGLGLFSAVTGAAARESA